MLTHLPTILWQRRWLIIIPAIVIALSAVAAAFLLPQTYVSTAVLLVESQNLLGPTTTNPANGDVIDRRIAKIREQILSRPDLVDLIQSHNLYDASSRSTPLSKIVEKMRAATELKAVNADITDAPVGKAASGSIAFSLSFEYAQAPEAQFVAQTFVNRLLALDASESQAQAQQNVRLLEDQQSTLQGQVTQIESQITQITGRNGAALANSGSLGMITLGGGDYESQIASLRRENAQLQAQSGSAATARDPGVVAAEAQLAAARARYSDDHPDVKLAERQLAAAKANATSFQANAVNQNVQNQIAANNQAIAQLSNARATTQSRAAAMAAAQARGPVVAQQVAQLQAKADQVRADLARITTSLLNARSVAKLTDEQQGDRLTLVDPPVTPDTPTKPNRPLFIAGGLLGGLAFGIALALAVEALQRPIRGAAALDRIFGVPPLGIIPIMSSKSSRRRRRKESSLLEEGLPR
jgi:uncharacterized protein involved in exopolysaccharide biosynthesis